MPQVHDLKIWPQFFAAIVTGRKTCEVRKNDRGYRIGDTLNLREYEPKRGIYTGQETQVKVVDLIENFDGLKRGYCVMSIKLLPGRNTNFNGEKAGTK
jgi:hypothetical protein